MWLAGVCHAFGFRVLAIQIIVSLREIRWTR